LALAEEAMLKHQNACSGQLPGRLAGATGAAADHESIRLKNDSISVSDQGVDFPMAEWVGWVDDHQPVARQLDADVLEVDLDAATNVSAVDTLGVALGTASAAGAVDSARTPDHLTVAVSLVHVLTIAGMWK
jgi:hypothetical protein